MWYCYFSIHLVLDLMGPCKSVTKIVSLNWTPKKLVTDRFLVVDSAGRYGLGCARCLSIDKDRHLAGSNQTKSC